MGGKEDFGEGRCWDGEGVDVDGRREGCREVMIGGLEGWGGGGDVGGMIG